MALYVDCLFVCMYVEVGGVCHLKSMSTRKSNQLSCWLVAINLLNIFFSRSMAKGILNSLNQDQA